jgi:Type IV pilin-like G and H, putative
MKIKLLALLGLVSIGSIALAIPLKKTTKTVESDREILTFLYSINRSEQTYHFERQQFTSSLEDLNIILPIDIPYAIAVNNLEDKNLAYTTAIPNRDDLPSFVGIIYFDEQNVSYKSVLCQSDRLSKVSIEQPTVSENSIICPPTFRYLPDFVINQKQPSLTQNSQSEAQASIKMILRGEQSYYFERGEFTDDWQNLGFSLPENSFYAVNLQISDRKLVNAIAIPNRDDLLSFVGSIYYDDKTSSFQTILCQSDRPRKVVAEFPSVSEDILQCPADFEALNDSTTDFGQKLAEEANISPVRVREVEARNAIGTFTRAEQSYHFEKNSFTDNLQDLGYSPLFDNPIYDFKTYLSQADNVEFVYITAIPNSEGLPSFIGGIYFDRQTGQYQMKPCQSQKYSKVVPETMTLTGDRLSCPVDFEEMP